MPNHTPPPGLSPAQEALWWVEASGLRLNDALDRAHEIAQAHEGIQPFDSIHALIHRIEGDDGNAAYWDRRAGTDFGGQGHVAELETLSALITG